MGCGSSVARQDEQAVKKRLPKPKPLEHIDQVRKEDSIVYNNNNDETKKEVQKKEEGEIHEVKQEDKIQNDGQSQATPLNVQATIKQIFIIPPYDSEGNLQDEIKTLEIKADVQSHLKKQKMKEAKKKQSQDSGQNDQDQSRSLEQKVQSENEELQQQQKLQKTESKYKNDRQNQLTQEEISQDQKQNGVESKQNNIQPIITGSMPQQEPQRSQQQKQPQKQSQQIENKFEKKEINPFSEQTEQMNKQINQKGNSINQNGRIIINQEPPIKAFAIKDIKDYVNQEDMLKKIKSNDLLNQNSDYFTEYIEKLNYEKSDYFLEDQFDLSPIIIKQDSIMDSQILMQIEDNHIKQGKPFEYDFTYNLLSDLKKQNYQPQYNSPNNRSWNNQKKIENPNIENQPNNNVDLLKMLKQQRRDSAEQQSPYSFKKQRQFETVSPSSFAQQQQQQQKKQDQDEQSQEDNQQKQKQFIEIEQSQPKQQQELLKDTNGEIKSKSSISSRVAGSLSESKKNQTLPPNMNLLSIKTDEHIKIPSQRKRLEKTKAQTLSLTNGFPGQQSTANSTQKNPQQLSNQGQMHDLNRINTFDTINDTISNASPINNSLANNNDTKPETKEDKFIFNIESMKKNGIKKQETNMTEELELIMKGMDERQVINGARHQKTLEQQKTEEFLLGKRTASIYNDLNLNKQQSELLASDKNSSNLICDFERNDSRDEFQISISSPLKNLQNSKVLHTNSIYKEINDEGKKQINQYILVKELGRGNCGKVKLGLDEASQKYFAIKISNKNKLKKKLISQKISAFTLLEQEIAIMKKVDHPNIVKLYEVIEDSEDNKLYLVMEFMKRGSILSSTYFKTTIQSQDPVRYRELYDENGQLKNKSNEPKSIDLTSALRYMRQMALALDYMHNFAQIVHRDIKPDNLLIDENDNLKVADFGISTLMEETDETSSNAGTKAFMSPETWEKKIFKATPLDIWATGVTLYYMIYGFVPFKEKKLIELKNEICTKEIYYPPIPELPEQAKDFLQRMLERNPDKRITAKEMLVHPWLTGDGQIVLKNIIDHSLKVEKSDLEKAIGRSQKISASVMIALGLKRVLKRARQSILLNEQTQNSLSSSTPLSARNRLSIHEKQGNKIENFSKFSQRALQEKQEKESETNYQKLNVSQILRDESFNN